MLSLIPCVVIVIINEHSNRAFIKVKVKMRVLSLDPKLALTTSQFMSFVRLFYIMFHSRMLTFGHSSVQIFPGCLVHYNSK